MGGWLEDGGSAVVAAVYEPWWEVVDSGTSEGNVRAVWLEEALEVFSVIVEVDGAEGDGQLSTELGNFDGEEGWRLGVVRLVEQVRVPVIQVVCVVSKGRARRGK